MYAGGNPHKSADSFGKELRRLRLKAGMSGRDLAMKIRVSPSKLSKLENGRLYPSERDVARIADVVGTSMVKREELILEARRLARIRRYGDVPSIELLSSIAEVREVGDSALRARMSTTTTVPWPLQTPDYVRKLTERMRRENGEGRRPDLIEASVVSRIERQAQLFDERRYYEIVMFESSLRPTFCLPVVIQRLCEEVFERGQLPNVSLSIIPEERERSFECDHTTIYDDTSVVMDIYPHSAVLRSRSVVRQHEERFAILKDLAVTGRHALDIVSRHLEATIDLRSTPTEYN